MQLQQQPTDFAIKNVGRSTQIRLGQKLFGLHLINQREMTRGAIFRPSCAGKSFTIQVHPRKLEGS